MPERSHPESLWKGRLPGLPEAAYLAVLRTADDLQSAIADLLKPYGLSPTQYNALRILRGAGEAGLACSKVGERMINRDPDITRLLDRLEARGLIARSRGKEDRRKIFATITHPGLVLLKKLDQPVEDFIHRLLGDVEESRLRFLVEFLEELGKNARAR
jgi:DNA-binding MarR family transcriptional regulator